MLKSGLRAIVNKQFFLKKLCHFYRKLENHQGMFGNFFFPLFYVSKNNFLFLRQKTCLATQNWQKTKIILKTQFVKETDNMQKASFTSVFNF